MTIEGTRKTPRQLDFSVFSSATSLVAMRSKVLYVPTPKVACSTIKTAVVRMEEPTRDAGFDPHSRGTHGLPSLGDLSREESDLVMSSPDWVRFCVTRRPYERLVSAWLNKIFAGQSLRTAPYAAELQRTRDVGRHFREFVHEYGEDSPLYRGDQHFVQQVAILRPESISYSHILDISELHSFAAWVRSSDFSRQHFDVSARLNTSLKVPLRAMYDRETAEIVEQRYHADFSAFGYEVQQFAEEAEEFLLSENELMLINRMASIEARSLVSEPLAQLAAKRVGAKYGAKEVLRSARARASHLRKGPGNRK